MSLHGAVVLLATFLLAASVLVTQGSITCYTVPSVAGEFNCLPSHSYFYATTIEECCDVGHSGYFFKGEGDESCQACIVFGFLNGSYITVPEQGWPYTILAIGFIKGGNVQPLTGIDRRNTARFGIIVAGSATEGFNGDFTIRQTLFEIEGPDARAPFNLITYVRFDGIALEPAEHFVLTVEGRNNAGRAILSPTQRGQFVVPTIRVVIEDVQKAVLQFTDSDHSSIESEEVLSPIVQLLTNIATDLTVAAIPVNYTFVHDSQSSLSDILDVLPDVPDYNPTRPIIATSFPFEDRDFSSTPVLITFPAGKPAVQRINIGIEDDDINEVEQVFVIFLQVVHAVDPARVDVQSGHFATLGRIFDDDPIIIGFEQNSYTISESLNASGCLTRIPIIKGNNQQSEITFEVVSVLVTGSGPNAANLNQVDPDRDLFTYGTSQRHTFSPDQQSITAYSFELINDHEPEDTEEFQVELSLYKKDSGVSIYLGGLLADGSTLFATTQIFIVDDDAIVIIGLEEVPPVNERHGFLEICVRTLDVIGNLFPPYISITLAANTIRGTASDPGDYEKLSESNGDLFFPDITATNSRACINVSIKDNNPLEVTESFFVQVVPDSFNHPTGLPMNFFLVPDLIVVKIINTN